MSPDEAQTLIRMLADLDERMARIERRVSRELGPLPPVERTYDWSSTKLIADEMKEIVG